MSRANRSELESANFDLVAAVKSCDEHTNLLKEVGEVLRFLHLPDTLAAAALGRLDHHREAHFLGNAQRLVRIGDARLRTQTPTSFLKMQAHGVNSRGKNSLHGGR